MLNKSKQHILVVEDDREICRLLKMFLQDEGFDVSFCHDGKEGVEVIVSEQPDLVLLDILMPGQDGIECCLQARERYAGPILMLTACDDDISEISALRGGADAYLRKPIRPEILLVHIQTLLRRVGKQRASEGLTIGLLKILPHKREVYHDDELLDLAGSEYELLLLLAQQAGTAIDRESCFKHLRGIDYDGLDRSLDMRISSLRRKLKDIKAPYKYIKTVRNQGYMLVKE